MPGHTLDLPHLDATALADLASALLRLPARPGWPDPPFLIALPWGDPWRVDDLGFDLEARPLGDGADALDTLCHQRAKPEWVAVGVVIDGWTVPASATMDVDWRSLRRDGPTLRLHPQRRRVRTLHVVGRGGPVALALMTEGGEPEVHATADGGAPGGPTGPLPDGLRRLFDLPTPPCPVAAVELWASLWLAAVGARAGHRRHAPMGWAAVAGLHPGAELLRRCPEVDPADHIVSIGNALARVNGWDILRLSAVGGGGGQGFLPSPAVAAWADAGMFARLVLREIEPLWASRRALTGQLGRATLAEIDATLAAWDLDPAPPGLSPDRAP